MSKMTLPQKIRAYLTVTVFTVLIWLMAEARTVKQQQIGFELQFEAPPGQTLVIDPHVSRLITMNVECSNRQFDRLASLVRLEPLKWEVHDIPGQPTRAVDLKTILDNHPLLADLSLNITEVRPSSIELRVERYETTTLPLVALTGDNVVDATVEPVQVTVRLPASLVPAATDVKAEIRLIERDLRGFGENVPVTLEMPVVLPPVLQRPFVTVTPPAAKVSFTIRKQTVEATLSSVPIHVNAPWSEIDHYSIATENKRLVLDQDVRVVGPQEVIQQILDRKVKVWAELILSGDYLASNAGKQMTESVVIRVPEGIRVEPPIPTVTFTITKLETSEP